VYDFNGRQTQDWLAQIHAETSQIDLANPKII